MASQQNPALTEYILLNVERYPDRVATLAASKFRLSRMGISRYMARLVEEGLLTAEGQTRARYYELTSKGKKHAASAAHQQRQVRVLPDFS